MKRAKLWCSQSSILDYVLTEKITGSAETSIRHTHIDIYEDLYKSLKTNLETTTSIELLGAQLSSHCLSKDGSSSKCWSIFTYPKRHEPSLDIW